MPSDSGLTAAEQAAMDADRAAEIEEHAAAAAVPQADDATPEGGAAATEGAAAAEGHQAEPRSVPLSHLMEERKTRQAAESALAEERRRSATLEERTNLILQRFAAPQPQAPAGPTAPAIPAFEDDPAGHILGQVRQQGAILGELVQAVTGRSRQDEAAAGVQQLTVRAAALEREFATANPDYDKASSHLFEMRRQELIAEGWTDPAEIQHMMANEATGLAHRAMSQGRNPAEVVYQLAKLRGYTAPVADTAANNGGTDAAASEAQLRTIAAGQQQSRSVGNLRGSGPAPLTATGLAAMSEEEFAQMLKTNPKGVNDQMGA